MHVSRVSRRRRALRTALLGLALVGGFSVLVLRGGGRPAGDHRRHALPRHLPEWWTGRCVDVADGDTVAVMFEGAPVKVRLHGIDCPERGQAFGRAARQFTARAVFDTEVRVYRRDTDRYGRTVAEVVMADGRSLNEALVGAGLAWWYRRYAPQDRALEALEAGARASRRGLWADPGAVPPWEYRRGV